MEAVLVIDSEARSCHNVKPVLEFLECDQVYLETYTSWLQDKGQSKEYKLVLVADALGEDSLMTLLADLKRWGEQLAVFIVSTAKLSSEINLPGNVLGRLSYPLKFQEITAALQQAEVFRSSAAQSKDKPQQVSLELFRSLVGTSRSISQIRLMIEQVSNSDATVLILGESGTGKEVVARNLHYHSSRRNQPFVPINCGAIPADLLESELFGHEKGAFTGAVSARQGRFEMANGGTLFLDEIGDMSMSMQVKLLRVLQERNFSRVGSNKLIEVDVRIVAATHRNLEKAIENGSFREDLFYRLNVFPIEMPPLRERSGDIPLLLKELVTRLENQKRGSVKLTQMAVMALTQYSWPGNIRELANLMERLVITHPFGVVDVHDLPQKYQPEQLIQASSKLVFDEEIYAAASVDAARLPREGMDLKKYLGDLECDLIKQALDDSNGVVAHAANKLNIRRTTLVEKLRKYGLQKTAEAT